MERDEKLTKDYLRFPLNEFYVSGPYEKSSNRMLLGTFFKPKDTSVFSIGSGEVLEATGNKLTLSIVEDNRRTKVVYRPVNASVSRGDKVEQGQEVARMSKPHLILSMLLETELGDIPVNPMMYLYRYPEQYNLHNIPAYTPRVKPLTPYIERKR